MTEYKYEYAREYIDNTAIGNTSEAYIVFRLFLLSLFLFILSKRLSAFSFLASSLHYDFPRWLRAITDRYRHM